MLLGTYGYCVYRMRFREEKEMCFEIIFNVAAGTRTYWFIYIRCVLEKKKNAF